LGPEQRNPGRTVEGAVELVEQAQELFLLVRRERRQDARLRPPRGLDEAGEHGRAGARELEVQPAPVVIADIALQEAVRFELGQHHSGRGPVQPQKLRDRNLIDARLVLDQQQNAELRIGDAKLAGFLDEQGHRDLVRPSDQESGPAVELFDIVRQCRHPLDSLSPLHSR
jgi:hypothetical protein